MILLVEGVAPEMDGAMTGHHVEAATQRQAETADGSDDVAAQLLVIDLASVAPETKMLQKDPAPKALPPQFTAASTNRPVLPPGGKVTMILINCSGYAARQACDGRTANAAPANAARMLRLA